MSFPVCPAAHVSARPLRWLWQNRLALGKLAVLDGDPQLGKTFIALDLCARLSKGLPWPDGAPSPGPANALVLSGEDATADTINARLQTLGADLARVWVAEDDGLLADPLQLPADSQRLDDALRETDARLLVLDPLVSFLDATIGMASDQSIRRALLPLAQLGERHNCTVLMNRHLNKSGASRALYRGAGSIGLIAACRSAWLVARDPASSSPLSRYSGRGAGGEGNENTTLRCILAQVKNNYAPPQPSLAYEIRNDGSSAAFAWQGPTAWTADLLLASQTPGRISALDRSQQFLITFLANGPRRVHEVWQAAQHQGLSERTLWRAKGELEIRSQRITIDGKPVTYWLLADQNLLEDDDPLDLEPWLGPLRQEFPPATPLEEME